MNEVRKARRQLNAGNVILAIKTLRNANGLPLVDAKNVVEGWMANNRKRAYARRRI